MLRASFAHLLLEGLRVFLALPPVEWGRRTQGPEPLLRKLRERARRSRSPDERAKLRRIIRFADARMPGGPNCYRRALLETALDAGAAKQRLVFGLKSRGAPGSGHVWLEGDTEGEGFEAEIFV